MATILPPTVFSLAAGASGSIIPTSSTTEWYITTLFGDYGVTFQVYTYDGTNTRQIDQYEGGSQHQLCWPINHTNYLILKNTSASTAFFGYAGLLLTP